MDRSFSPSAIEADSNLPTVLGYGHGDVIQRPTMSCGPRAKVPLDHGPRSRATGSMAAAPPTTRASIALNMAAMARGDARTRGQLGFNAKALMIEMGEENGSKPDCARLSARPTNPHFAADTFIGSDGPRVISGTCPR